MNARLNFSHMFFLCFRIKNSNNWIYHPTNWIVNKADLVLIKQSKDNFLKQTVTILVQCIV